MGLSFRACGLGFANWGILSPIEISTGLPRTLGGFDLLSIVHGYEIVSLFCVASCRQVCTKLEPCTIIFLLKIPDS